MGPDTDLRSGNLNILTLELVLIHVQSSVVNNNLVSLMSHASGHHFHQVQETGHADVDVLRHRIYRGCYLHQSWKRAFCQNRSCQRRSVDHHSGKRIWIYDK